MADGFNIDFGFGAGADFSASAAADAITEQSAGTEAVAPAPEGDPSGAGAFFDASMRQAMSALPAAVNSNPRMGADTPSFSPADLVDPFSAQKNYDPVGFNPFDYQGNTKRAADSETWGDALWKGLKGAGHNAWSSFTAGPEASLRTYGALATLGAVDLEVYNDSEKLLAYYEDQDFRNKNMVFDPTKRFVADFESNLGFTAGTIGYMALEFAATELLTGWFTGGTSGLASVGKNIPLLGRAFSRFTGKTALSGADDLARGAEMAKNGLDAAKSLQQGRSLERSRETVSRVFKPFSEYMKEMNKAGSLWEKALITGERIPLAGTFVKTGRQMGQAAKMGAGAGELLSIGRAGFRRAATEFSAASAEASLETVHTYGDLYTGMMRDHQSRTGQVPTPEEMDRMAALASKASTGNYATNMGILLISNKLQFGNLFNKYLPANKALASLMSEGGEKAFAVTGKLAAEGAEQGTKRTTRFFSEGALGRIGAFGQIKKEFGTKIAMREAGKGLLRGAYKSPEFVEGFQELAQEASNVSWSDYYRNVYDGIPGDMSRSAAKGLGAQMNKRGVETFLTGALTGMVMRPFSRASEMGMQAVTDYRGKTSRADRKQAKERLDAGVTLVNDFLANPSKGMKESVRAYNEQYEASSEMAEAAKRADHYTFGNRQTDALYSAVRAARSMGTDKVFAQAIRDAGEVFNEEEFKEAFGVDVRDTEHKTVGAFTNKVARDIEHVSKTIDELTRKFSPIVEGSAFSSPESQIRYAYWKKANEEAIERIAYHKIRSDDSAARADGIIRKLSADPMVGTSSDFVFRALTSPGRLLNEERILRSELIASERDLDALLKNVNNAPETARLRADVKNKKRKLDLLHEWGGFFNKEGRFAPEDYTGTVNTFGDILKTWNTDMGTGNWDESQTQFTHMDYMRLSEIFGDVEDFMLLDTDTRGALEAYATLSRPQYFATLHKRVAEGMLKGNIEMWLTDAQRQLERWAVDTGDVGILKEFVQHEAYKKLLALYLSPEYSYTLADYAYALAGELTTWKDSRTADKGGENSEEPAPSPVPAAALPVQEEDDEEQPVATPETPAVFSAQDAGDGKAAVIDDVGRTVTPEPVATKEAAQMVETLNEKAGEAEAVNKAVVAATMTDDEIVAGFDALFDDASGNEGEEEAPAAPGEQDTAPSHVERFDAVYDALVAGTTEDTGVADLAATAAGEEIIQQALSPAALAVAEAAPMEDPAPYQVNILSTFEFVPVDTAILISELESVDQSVLAALVGTDTEEIDLNAELLEAATCLAK